MKCPEKGIFVFVDVIDVGQLPAFISRCKNGYPLSLNSYSSFQRKRMCRLRGGWKRKNHEKQRHILDCKPCENMSCCCYRWQKAKTKKRMAIFHALLSRCFFQFFFELSKLFIACFDNIFWKFFIIFKTVRIVMLS